MSRPAPEAWWRGRRVWITGHTGFKGGWLSLMLQQWGAQLHGLALPPATSPSLFEAARVGAAMTSVLGDIRDSATVLQAARAAAPEIVFHLAAQPLVRQAHADPVGTWATNVMGTAHVLDAVATLDSVRVVIVVTTDKVYANQEWPWAYRETDRLGGCEAYGASKAATELVADSWRDRLAARGVALMTVRAGNVIGGGDWSADRLIPDAMRAWSRQQPLVLRNPQAVRPWQHVLDCLDGYLMLAEALASGATRLPAPALNFGPAAGDARSVQAVVDGLIRRWGAGAAWQQDPTAQPYEARLLEVDSALARDQLGWRPRWPIETTLDRTLAWYRAVLAGSDAQAATLTDVKEFYHG